MFLGVKITATVMSSFIAFSWIANGQAAQRPTERHVLGPYDQTLSFPKPEGVSGEKDPEALRIIQGYLAATSHGSWNGVSATGSFSLGPENAGQAVEASLEMDASGRARLDLSLSSGVRSIRMSGSVGGVVQENGSLQRFPADVAGAGLFVTPHTLARAIDDPTATLIHDGIVVLEERKLLKVTYTRPLNRRSSGTSTLVPPLVTSLYFDPTTFLLVKTADTVRISDSSKAKHLRVIGYSEYSQASGLSIPYRYRETVDGSVVWTLVLKQAKAGSSQEASYFQLGEGKQ